MRLHLGKGEFDGERLLPAALIGELHAPRIYNTSPSFVGFGEEHYGLGFRSSSYRGDRLVFHGGGWIGWGTLMTLVPDFGIGVAVFTNRSPSQVPPTLTCYGPSPTGMGSVDEHVTFKEFFHVVKFHVLSAYDYMSRPG